MALWLKVWRPARMRDAEIARRVRQLGAALANALSAHDNPDYRRQYLEALFARTSRPEDS